MARTSKMTIKYWNSLDEGSRRRALTCVYPLHKSIVDMLMDSKPDLKDPFWSRVFKLVRVPEDNSHYKTIINNTYYM